MKCVLLLSLLSLNMFAGDLASNIDDVHFLNLSKSYQLLFGEKSQEKLAAHQHDPFSAQPDVAATLREKYGSFDNDQLEDKATLKKLMTAGFIIIRQWAISY